MLTLCNSPMFYHRVMRLKDADVMANSKDPDKTATLGSDCCFSGTDKEGI